MRLAERLRAALDEGSRLILPPEELRDPRITGDIAYEAITIDTGAQVDGQLRRIVREEGGEAALIVDARPEDPLRLFNVETPAA